MTKTISLVLSFTMLATTLPLPSEASTDLRRLRERITGFSSDDVEKRERMALNKANEMESYFAEQSNSRRGSSKESQEPEVRQDTYIPTVPVEPALSDALTVVRDIAYGPDPEQRLDVYYNPNFVDAPVLVSIHGGGWVTGDKAIPQEIADYIVNELGFILIRPNYRLSSEGENQFPTPVEDAYLTTLKALEIASQYGGSDDIVMYGNSAGGHLAAMVTYANDTHDPAEAALLTQMGLSISEADMEKLNVAIKGFIASAGTYDFDAVPENRKQVQIFLGDLGTPDNWDVAEPVNYVSKGDPPALLLTGAQDCYVNKVAGECGNAELPKEEFNGSFVLGAALSGQGISHEVIEVSGYGHVDFMKEIFLPGMDPVLREELMAEIDDFLYAIQNPLHTYDPPSSNARKDNAAKKQVFLPIQRVSAEL